VVQSLAALIAYAVVLRCKSTGTRKSAKIRIALNRKR
jgi:hypothetical protein